MFLGNLFRINSECRLGLSLAERQIRDYHPRAFAQSELRSRSSSLEPRESPANCQNRDKEDNVNVTYESTLVAIRREGSACKRVRDSETDSERERERERMRDEGRPQRSPGR
jgi:hypothetical protein